MGTPYSLVYKRAITEFKDPTLKQLFSTNSILFFEVMYNYLENAIQLFTNPVSVSKKLEDTEKPYLQEQYFKGNGLQDIFVLDIAPTQEQLENVVFQCEVNGEQVECSYLKDSNSVKLDITPEVDSVVAISWYFVGVFNSELNSEEVYILSQFIMACWSEYIFNDKLDVIRLLGDTDFKLPANGTTTTAKTGWNIVNRETVTKRMNHYAWMQSFNKYGEKK